jgi:hypothetical protein
MGIETIIGIAAVAVSAVGVGMSYSASHSAAEQQNRLALLNAQAQTQGARQEGQLGMMQAKLNADLSARDQQAADEMAKNLELQAAMGSKSAENDIRKSRTDYERLIASQRVQAAKAGVLDTSGSPLELLVRTSERSQQEAEALRYQDEINRRGLFNQATVSRNQGIMAGIQGMSAMSAGYGAQGRAAQGVAQANLNLYSSRASSQAMRNQATSSLIAGAGNLAQQSYSNFRPTPSSGATSARY